MWGVNVRSEWRMREVKLQPETSFKAAKSTSKKWEFVVLSLKVLNKTGSFRSQDFSCPPTVNRVSMPPWGAWGQIVGCSTLARGRGVVTKLPLALLLVRDLLFMSWKWISLALQLYKKPFNDRLCCRRNLGRWFFSLGSVKIHLCASFKWCSTTGAIELLLS